MKTRKFDYVVGTGGIGTGMLFRFSEDRTLGRNESRMAQLTDVRDYCKQHIILHYIAVLGPDIPVYAIGRVGEDTQGTKILEMMERYRIRTDYIKRMKDAPTLFSVCFTYPDSDGGNITTSNSASSFVSNEDIDAFFKSKDASGNGFVVAAPEVAVSVRKHLLIKGKEKDCYTAASFASAEIEECMDENILRYVDFLTVNKDEMRSIMRVFGYSEEAPFSEGYRRIRALNPNLQMIVTLGREGAIVFSQANQMKVPAIWRSAENTAGAGDCFLGTMIASMLSGIPLMDTNKGAGSPVLASLAAALKVENKDTISQEITREAVYRASKEMGIEFTDRIYKNFFGSIIDSA